MEPVVNTQLAIIREAWNRLVGDYRDVDQYWGYLHDREEDIRSYLFCKIVDILSKRKLDIMNLHADILVLGKKRADIVLWDLGIEIKRSISREVMEEQLNKIQDFMLHKKIKAGVFLAIIQHSYGLEEMLPIWGLKDKFRLEKKDKGNNNFIETQRIIIENAIDWDALFLVLRTC